MKLSETSQNGAAKHEEASLRAGAPRYRSAARTGAVRTLEQRETGEIRVLRCSVCGKRWFSSDERLWRHQVECGEGSE
jgi:hypothetical protein